MKVTKTAKLQILNRGFSLQPTLDIYSSALELVLCVIWSEKEAIKILK